MSIPNHAPIAKKRAHVHRYHDQDFKDPYHWLRVGEESEIRLHLQAENAYLKSQMRPTAKLQERLYQEMKGRIQETDQSVPYFYGGFQYYSRTEEGKDYKIYCRRQGSMQSAEEILLDLNALAPGQPYLALGNFSVSPKHDLLAYAVDFSGDENYTLYVKDLRTGQLDSESVEGTYYGLEWGNDNATLFYTKQDAAYRPHQAWRRKRGSSKSDDMLLFQEDDERFHVSLYKSRSERFLFVESESQTTTEIRFLEADEPQSNLKVMATRVDGVEYSAVHREEQFFILTNDQAINFRLVKAPIENPGRAGWQEVLEHDPAVYRTDLTAFRDHLVLWEREAGQPQLRIFSFSSRTSYRVEMPESIYEIDGGDNPEYESQVVRFQYSSPTTPDSVFDLNMNTRERVLLRERPIRGGYDRTKFCNERCYAEDAHGIKIPISLVYRRDLKRDGSAPLLLQGYGSYGLDYETSFDSLSLCLLERGVVIAIAHVRGGSEMGREWYKSGKLQSKQNTFEDFIVAAEYLIRHGYTSANRLAASGGSAGGLLMGAVANKRPDLFHAIIANVPFVDVINTMMDDTLPLVAIEYEEWGNPNDPKVFEYLQGYSPYENVQENSYPNMLVLAGWNDPRVSYWEPAKWVAKLRELNQSSNLVLLQTNLETGHGGASGRYEALREQALEFAFLLHCWGIEA